MNALTVEICDMGDAMSDPISSPAAHCFIAQHVFAAWVALILSQCSSL
jgi:hypothetical protein